MIDPFTAFAAAQAAVAGIQKAIKLGKDVNGLVGEFSRFFDARDAVQKAANDAGKAGKYDYRAMVTDDEARIEFRQRTNDGGWETIGITSFTMDDAKRAGLGGDNWRKYPKAMLFARAISAGYKAHCPDALGAAPVYVEAHGESEIPEEPKAETKAISPAAMREMTREERREDVRKLLDSGKAETPAPLPKGDDTFLIPKTAKIARVKGPKGDVWRVDVEGHAPIAVKEPTIASGIEANLAFEEPTLVRLEHDGKREIVMEII